MLVLVGGVGMWTLRSNQRHITLIKSTYCVVLLPLFPVTRDDLGGCSKSSNFSYFNAHNLIFFCFNCARNVCVCVCVCVCRVEEEEEEEEEP